MSRQPLVDIIRYGLIFAGIAIALQLPWLLESLHLGRAFSPLNTIVSAMLATGAACVASWIYRRRLYPLLSGLSELTGWWQYSLIALPDVTVAGYFNISSSTGSNLHIGLGHSFHVTPSGLRFRGSWVADAISTGHDQLSFVFHMHTVTPTREMLPSKYSGYIELRRDHSTDEYWYGSFSDLGERRLVSGPIIAARLKEHQPESESAARGQLVDDAPQMLKLLHARLG